MKPSSATSLMFCAMFLLHLNPIECRAADNTDNLGANENVIKQQQAPPPSKEKPVAVKPAVVKPVAVKPATHKPVPAKPGPAKPATVKPTPIKPSPAKVATALPKTTVKAITAKPEPEQAKSTTSPPTRARPVTAPVTTPLPPAAKPPLPFVHGQIVELTEENLEEVVRNSEMLLINFYVAWCPFSRKLGPIWEDLAAEATKWFQPQKVVFGRINCEEEALLQNKFNVKKFPTMKLIMFGRLMKHEYRGDRTVEALIKYVSEMAKDPIHYVTKEADLEPLLTNKTSGGSDKSVVIRVSAHEQSDADPRQFYLFRKIAAMLRYDCQFVWFTGTSSKLGVSTDRERLVFRSTVTSSLSPENNLLVDEYGGHLDEYQAYLNWVDRKCNPLVREVTFENAEELTEEGLPMAILFTRPDDKASIRTYTDFVEREMNNETGKVMFAYANGEKFRYPLLKVKKTIKDLPCLVIDDLSHMYVFGNFSDIHVPGKLQSFIANLHSGKLHMDYHQNWIKDLGKALGVGDDDEDDEDVGDNSKDNEINDYQETEKVYKVQKPDQPSHANETGQPKRPSSESPISDLRPAERVQPPESTFRKLAPSEKRYTLTNKLKFRDEL